MRVAASLSVVFLASLVVACGRGEAAAPSAAPSVSAAVSSAAPSATPVWVKPSDTPTDGPSDPASAAPPGSGLPSGTVLTVEVPGTGYVRLDESEGGKITEDGESLIVKTVRDSFISTRIGYDLPDGSVPPGTVFAEIDMKLCGEGTGDFWETYAPSGGEPFEQEVTQPLDDGCWHFDDAKDGDPYFESFVVGESTMRIDKIVYTLTVA